jgi:prepilin-type N-terminal cleavage/methylation domain-containing protein/prepilin-type processing-associated H-X9-DG protein
MRPTRTGFTLLEMLIVVCIIVILVGILLPVLIGAKNKAEQTECVLQLKQLQLAVRQYAGDNEGGFPFLVVTDTADGVPVRWVNSIYPYCGGSKLIFACPLNPVYADPGSRPEPRARMPETSYYYNGNSLGGLPETQVRDQGTTISIMDGWFIEGKGGSGGLNYPLYYSPWATPDVLAEWVNNLTMKYVGVEQLLRMHAHNGGVCAAYVDGHVKWLTSGKAVDFDPTAGN